MDSLTSSRVQMVDTHGQFNWGRVQMVDTHGQFN